MYLGEQKILLIIPCYNEETRLNKEIFTQISQNITLVFANDGSKDSTLNVLENIIKNRKNTQIYNSIKNVGKANVIQAAFQSVSKDKNFIQQFDWIGFWDADLATPFDQIDYLINFRNLFSPQYDIIFSSRVSRCGSNIKRNPLRHYLSRVFLTFADLIVGLKVYDSQCGAKLMKLHKA